jgi:hypothetical protein
VNAKASVRIGAVVGILGGLVAIGDGLYAHFQSPQPVFGIPSFLFVYSQYLSGVHMLVGLGVIMVIGGALAFRWPALGIGIVCAGALIGLISVYDRGRPPFMGDSLRTRWMPYFYYWAAPWVLAWISGIFGGLALQKSIKPHASPAPIDKPGVAPAAE